MEDRNISLLSWINNYIKTGPEVTDINTVCSSQKFMDALKNLVPQELYPNETDNLTYIAIVIITLIREQGYLDQIPQFLSSDQPKNNQTTLFFLYVLYRLKFPNDKVEESKAENMFEKFKISSKASDSLPFNFEASQKSLEEENLELQKSIDNYKSKYQDLKKQYDSIEQNVLEQYQSKLESEMHEAAEAEKINRNLLNEKEKCLAQLDKLTEDKQRLQEKHKDIQEIEEENKKLREDLFNLEKKNQDFQTKQQEIKLSGINKAHLEMEISETSKEIEELRKSKELLKIDEIPEDDGTLKDLLDQIDELEEKVNRTDPEKVISKWKHDINLEIEKAKADANRAQLIIELGEALK